jgi:hypothetical protein
MSNNHVITKNIGNLRGFSTDSIFTRPSNVADKAINIQLAPDGTLQLRRGYQCQIAEIGGMGTGTFDDPVTDEIHTVTVSTDGFLYNKLTKQIYFYYDGRVMGDVSAVTNPSADLTQITSNGHGLQTGAQVILRDLNGANELNNTTFTITVVDANNFTLDGVLFSSLTPYVSGGNWSIAFADQRYLTFSIFTDPRFLVTNPGWSVAPWSFSPWGSPSGESITCNIIVNRAAQIDGNQSNINTVNVEFGHELFAGDTIQFYASNGVFNQRLVLSVTATSITFDGFPVSVLDGVYINQFFDIPFRKGFDVTSPYLISTFINTITSPTTGVFGLQIAINGDDFYPAAFLQIIEPTIIDSNREFIIDYWYWERINSTVNPPFPGSANILYQNSPDFENASTAVFDDVIYIANGWDFPQKYDGQTVYRTGMPIGIRPPDVADQVAAQSMPFLATQVYEYAITYEQVDALGHIVEGEVSTVRKHTVGTTPSAMDVTVNNILPALGPPPYENWNTNGAIAVAGTATVYGPDVNGFYYDFVPLVAGFTLKIGDNAYYADQTSAVMTGGALGPTNTLNVLAGHSVLEGDTVYFFDTGANRTVQRVVELITATTITVLGTEVTVNSGTAPNIMVYQNSIVFGNVAIVNGNQSNLNNILVIAGHTVQLGDVVEFIDSQSHLQRRTVTFVDATHVTVSGIPISISTGFLIYSINQRTDALNFQRLNPNGITFIDHVPLTSPYGTLNISNNLKINIYRTFANESFGVNGDIFLVAAIPNNSLGGATQDYTDGLIGIAGTPNIEELGREFDDPDQAPNPPPISKYIKAFGNQMFYAGGERGNPDNSDRVFFSGGNAPEVVPLATNSFNVPNLDDNITGIGVSGTTLVTTKNHSLWAATGNFLTGDIDVVQIASGTNIGCVAHATIASVGTLMYFLHTNGVYAITENQLYPTDTFGNPVPISLAINGIFRETNFLPQTRYVFKRAVACNYTKDNQYLLFVPCEDIQSTIRTANAYSIILCYDYQEKNWFTWQNMNAAGGIFAINDDLYFQERRFSAVDGNVANLYKQHRFYRLVDHADHAGPQRAEWRASWEDLGQPEVRKKFCRCILLMDRLSELFQLNNPELYFSTYLNRIPNLQNTMAKITPVDNIRNSSWSYSGWGWNFWSGYQDSFITVNLKQGTVAKSIQVGFTLQGINMDIRLAGFQLEAIPENRKTVVR